MDKVDLPLAPLSAAALSFLETLGPPKSWTVQQPGRLDAAVTAWLIGDGEITFGTSPAKGYTTVEIWLTAKGRLLTFRKKRFDLPRGGQTEDVSSQFHETPGDALRWLKEDGKGKLGGASKVAWVKACRTFPPMAGMDLAAEDDGVTLRSLLEGRTPLLCECGAEVFVEHVSVGEGNVLGRFIPCKCGSQAPIYVPPGSIVGSFEWRNPLHVWGPKTGR